VAVALVATQLALVATQLLKRPTLQPGRFAGLTMARTSLMGAYTESMLAAVAR
jgi:hypothetical protein